MFEIKLKETGKKYCLPLTFDDLYEIKKGDGNEIVQSDEFEVLTYNGIYKYMPYGADLDALDAIATDILTLEVRKELPLLQAIMDANAAGKVELKTNLTDKYYTIQTAIAGIYEGRFAFSENMTPAQYAETEYKSNNLDFLDIDEDIADCIDWQKVFNKFLKNDVVVINGGILFDREKAEV